VSARDILSAWLDSPAAHFGDLEIDALHELLAGPAAPLEALRLIHDWRGLCDEDRLHAWERIGADFYRDTGYLRPGKDEPMGFETPDGERADAWKAWTAEQNARIDAALREALAGPVTVTVGPREEEDSGAVETVEEHLRAAYESLAHHGDINNPEVTQSGNFALGHVAEALRKMGEPVTVGPTPEADRRVELSHGHLRVCVSWRNRSNGLSTVDLLRHLEARLGPAPTPEPSRVSALRETARLIRADADVFRSDGDDETAGWSEHYAGMLERLIAEAESEET